MTLAGYQVPHGTAADAAAAVAATVVAYFLLAHTS
jgi:hypothetical protein